MSQIVTLDLRDAPPANLGQRQGYLDPGFYVMRITDAVESLKDDVKMITISFTAEGVDYGGTTLVEYFKAPSPPKYSKFGMQRMHALLLALGVTIKNPAEVRFDLDKLIGKVIGCHVIDEQKAAQGQWEARTVSRIAKWENLNTSDGKAEKAQPQAAPVASTNGTAKAATKQQAPAAPPADDDPTTDDPATIAQTSEEIDDLFQ